MKYVRVLWQHDYLDEPVELYSELDEDRWELRKVEVFRDARYGYAWSLGSSMTTQLSDEPLPESDEIAKDAQFVPEAITAAEFELVWKKAIAQ